MPALRLILPFATPSQNQTERWHWAQKARLRDEVQLMTRVAMRKAGLPPGYRETRRMVLRVVRHGPKPLDFGNLVGGFKWCLDALVREGALRDDSTQWVSEHYSQATPHPDHPDGVTFVTLDPEAV